MAKVTGPLYSMTASGKIADAMVFFGWKGISVVRQWLKPANPMTEDQGDVRLLLGALGASAKAAKVTSLYRVDAGTYAGVSNTWVSKMVKYLRDNIFPAIGSLATEEAEFEDHNQYTVFINLAAARGLTDFSIAYASVATPFSAGLQLYELAKYAIAVHAADPTLFNRVPYTVSLSGWSEANVTAFGADLLSV